MFCFLKNVCLWFLLHLKKIMGNTGYITEWKFCFKINCRVFKELGKMFSSCILCHIVDLCPVEVSKPDDKPL